MSTARNGIGTRLAMVAGVLVLLAVSPALARSPGRATKPEKNKQPLVVHEWGTFLSVQGSDGVTLGGMVESDEILPAFVEVRGERAWDRVTLRQKMETPVTYFYVGQPTDISVRVTMPQGLLTHWFPPVQAFGPGPAQDGKMPAKNSYLDWRTFRLIPDRPEYAALLEKLAPPKVGSEQTWRYVRDTDSAWVKLNSWDWQGKPARYLEKFLFYRGLGTFGLPLEIQSREDARRGLHLTVRNTHAQPLRSLFAVWVEHDTIRTAALGDLAGGATQDYAATAAFTDAVSLAEGVASAKNAVAESLVKAGLFPKEAQAMVNTWERSYFRTEGIRLLYVLPATLVDQVIPIQIKPQPDELVRVMVGRVEVLTPERERRIAKCLLDLGAEAFKVRKAATDELTRLGRITEPALHRVIAQTHDPEVRARAASIIRDISKGQ